MAGSQIVVAVRIVGARLRVHTGRVLVTAQMVRGRSLHGGRIPLVGLRSVPLLLLLLRLIPLGPVLLGFVPLVLGGLLVPLVLGGLLVPLVGRIPLVLLRGVPLLLLLLLRIVQVRVVAVRVRRAQRRIDAGRELSGGRMLAEHRARCDGNEANLWVEDEEDVCKALDWLVWLWLAGFPSVCRADEFFHTNVKQYYGLSSSM